MRTTILFAAVVAALTAAAPLAAAQIGSTTDLWDFSRGAVVTAHSPFDIDGGDHGGYDARDAFGGVFNEFPAAYGAVIFTDFRQPGSVHYLEWRTPAPIDLERFTMSCSADHHAEDLRATSSFRLFAREEAGAPWILLHEGVRAPSDILDHPIWLLDHEFETPCRGLSEFRAEFVQASANTEYGGPRVFELDGFGTYTWAAGLERTAPTNAPSLDPARRFYQSPRFDAPAPIQQPPAVTSETARKALPVRAALKVHA